MHVAGNSGRCYETILVARMKSDIENMILTLDSTIDFKIHDRDLVVSITKYNSKLVEKAVSRYRTG